MKNTVVAVLGLGALPIGFAASLAARIYLGFDGLLQVLTFAGVAALCFYACIRAADKLDR